MPIFEISENICKTSGNVGKSLIIFDIIVFVANITHNLID